MSDSVYIATGTLRLGAKKHIAGSIITLSDDDAAVFAEVIRPASSEEIAVYEATQVETVQEPVKEPVSKAPVKTAAEKKAEKDAAAAAKKAEEDAAAAKKAEEDAAAAKKAEEDAAAAAGGNGETLV